MSTYTIKKDFHSKKGIDIWIVKLNEKTDYSQFKENEKLVKQAGGYYSKFVRGFVFEKEPSEQLLNEIFGGNQSLSDVAKSAGVSTTKVAKILMSNKYQSVRRDVLKSEIQDGKLLGARSSFFNGMTDMSEQIKEVDMVWEEAGSVAGIMETLSRDYHKPYVSGSRIKLGDYELKYKEGIVQPEAPKSIRQRSSNFYVILDDERNDEDKYSLDRVDSDKKDIENGTRVVSSMYGKKACGEVIDKKVNVFTVTKWAFGSNATEKEEQVSVNYTVKFDNGVINTHSTFKVDDGNECNGFVMPKGIIYNDDYKFPEAFYSSEIKGVVKTINSLKEQKSGRKKKEYADQDQRAIDLRTKAFRDNASKWLKWELEYPSDSMAITGESKEEYDLRVQKWKEEFNIEPAPYSIEGGAKSSKEEQLEKQEQKKQLIEKIKDHVAAKGYKFPTKMLQDIYLTLLVRRLFDGYKFEQMPERIHLIATNLAGKGNEKARQMQINQITGQLVAPSNARVVDVEEVWKQWLANNTDALNVEISLESPKKEEEIVVVKEEEKSLSLTPEQKITALEKRIKGLEIAYSVKQSPEIEKRIKGLKISLSVLK